MGAEYRKWVDHGVAGWMLYWIYGIPSRLVRRNVLRLCWHLIGRHNQFYSATLRRIFAEYHDVQVGAYSHGACFIPGRLPPGTRVGRYCSFGVTMTVHDANHPMNTKSTHAFFFNPTLGYMKDDIIPMTRLEVGNDVWIGHNAIILPSCSHIADGAVIGAGAVVNKSVPPYAIVVGNPGRVVRYRFDEETIENLLQERWWDKDIDDLVAGLAAFTTPLDNSESVR